MTDGRRVENQIAELRETYRIIIDTLTDNVNELQQRVVELMERVDWLQFGSPECSECGNNGVTAPCYCNNSPAECPKCNNTGHIRSTLFGANGIQGVGIRPCDCGRAPVLMNQPAADDVPVEVYEEIGEILTRNFEVDIDTEERMQWWERMIDEIAQVTARSQPSDECQKCNNKGYILSYRAGGHSLKPCDCGRAPIVTNMDGEDG